MFQLLCCKKTVRTHHSASNVVNFLSVFLWTVRMTSHQDLLSGMCFGYFCNNLCGKFQGQQNRTPMFSERRRYCYLGGCSSCRRRVNIRSINDNPRCFWTAWVGSVHSHIIRSESTHKPATKQYRLLYIVYTNNVPKTRIRMNHSRISSQKSFNINANSIMMLGRAEGENIIIFKYTHFYWDGSGEAWV